MNIKKYYYNNIEKINIYIIFLDHLKNEYNNKKNYNVHKIMSEFFLQIFNNEDIQVVKTKFLKDIKYKKITLLYDIDFNKKIEIKKIKYSIKQNNEIVNINFTIKYNDNKINIYKNIPNKIYNKIKKKGKEKYLLFFYIIVDFDTGQFWGLHPNFYNYIKENYKNTIECFASPFNNNLNDYFSLIYPIDKFYGSKGNFFENFLKVKYDIYIINPPFVESIISKVLLLIEEKLKTKVVQLASKLTLEPLNEALQIFIYIPQWDDLILPWYNKMSETYYLKIFKLESDNTMLFDYINNKSIKDTFGTYIICINNISYSLCNKIKSDLHNIYKLKL
jgi:hypothetical protein